MALTAAEIFRDYETDGVPSSGAHDPKKSNIRQLLGQYELIINAFTSNGGLIYSSKAAMDADLAHDANSSAWLVGDATTANNGVYQKSGASGSGSWTRIADLPYSFIPASDAGAGTPDAIVATSSLPISGSALVLLNIFEANTGSPVTVSFNGGTSLTIKTNSGNDVAPGGLVSGMLVLGRVSGSTFRLVSDQASAALLAQMEGLLLAAEDAATRAETAASGVEFPVSYAPQVLTDAQKAQARENIGAGTGASGIDPKLFGAVYDGSTDDSVALAAADAAAVTAGSGVQISGEMALASDITVESDVFFPKGGVLIPGADVLVTLASRVDAGPYQIFDRSQGGAIQFAKGAGTVWAEWWGARAEPSGRPDNEVPIQHAIDACGSVLSSGTMGPAPNADGNGGTVRFASNQVYLTSGRIHVRNRTILKGNGGYGPELKLNTATWNGDTEMVLFQNATFSQFWCRMEDMIVNADGLSTLNRVIYAPAWQESCGLRDVLVRNFYNTALEVDSFYGGSVGFTLKQVQFFPWSTPGTFVRAIDVTSPATVARQRILLEDISFAGITDSAPPGLNMVGIRATGRVDLICRGVFVEGYDIGCLLRGAASLFGDFTGPGNPSVEDLIEADSDFVGRVDCVVSQGSATHVLRSFKSSPSTLQRYSAPYSRRVVYPVTPTEVFAAGRVSGGAGTPAVSNSFGVSSVSKDGTGLYTLTFNTSEFNPGAGTDYRVRVAVQSTNTRSWFVSAATTTGVQLGFKDTTTNTAADVGDFDFEIVGRPGF